MVDVDESIALRTGKAHRDLVENSRKLNRKEHTEVRPGLLTTLFLQRPEKGKLKCFTGDIDFKGLLKSEWPEYPAWSQYYDLGNYTPYQ